MPEYPDICLYVDRLSERVVGRAMVKMRTYSPGILKTYNVPAARFEGQTCTAVSRVGKRIVFEFGEELFLVVHLMISGRFAWQEPCPIEMAKKSKVLHATWDWTNGRLSLNEFSTKKRAGIFLLDSRAGVQALGRGGIDVQTATLDQFSEALKQRNQSVKRALTDPSLFDGIGNAYSDEILFQAALSPVRLTSALNEEETKRLQEKTKQNLAEWRDKLIKEVKGFPKTSDVTAFRPDFYVHGRYNQPCRVCGAPIQRIVFSENECNYCARCQNGGRLLADRSLSRLLKDEWPKMIEDLE